MRLCVLKIIVENNVFPFQASKMITLAPFFKINRLFDADFDKPKTLQSVLEFNQAN